MFLRAHCRPKQVDAGSQLVGEAGATMGEIVAPVREVSSTVNEILATVSEQSGGIGRLSLTVAHLDQATQQNAALVEESAAAALALKEQSAKLAQAGDVFRLER